jgi:hypothetical protein
MMLERNEDISLSNYDQRDILSNLSSELSLDNIEQQIIQLFDETEIPKNSMDCFENIIQKYNFLHEKYKDNEDFIPELEQIMDEMVTNVLTSIEQHFDFKVTFSEALLFDTKIHYIHMIYNFLVNNIEDNMESLLYNYFINNIKEFPIVADVDTKNQAYVNLKGVIPNDYLNQIYFFTDNIESIKTYNLLAEDVLELMIENDPMKECNFWCTKVFIDNLFTDIAYGDKFKDNIIKLAFNSNKIYKVQNLVIKKYCIN